MPLIHITQAAAMDPDRSAEVLRSVTEAYATASGTPPEKVWVYITEVDREQWSTGGTTLAERDRAIRAEGERS
ncbi:hypothetical protein CZ771_04650 [Actinomycetales bacterium JB111]|nr:hypothetical protein CZ771_04650 [Actinomycetales bacterium JB111]